MCKKQKKEHKAHIPNAATIAAIEELESGVELKEVCLDSYEAFIASMED
ncbi:MAG: hypothetical protein J5663_11615 [Bacteroidaceae bacterium]|nr:hypothetical protein [Bacteroidaceae bacterium]